MISTKNPHRMIKVKVAARAPQDDSYYTASSSSTQTPMQSTASQISDAAPTDHPVVNLSTSTATLAGVVTLLGLILIAVLGFCFYRQKQRRNKKAKAPSAAFDFDRDLFTTEKKKSKLVFDQPRRDNLANKIIEAKASPGTQSTFSSSSSSSSDSEQEASTAAGSRPQANGTFRVRNNNDESSNTYHSKSIKEKKRASREKPAWVQSLTVNMNPEDMIMSPPPSYDIANGGKEFLYPIPAQLPPEKAKIPPTPPTPPANRKSHASSFSSKKARSQYLEVPEPDPQVPLPLPSPIRSESFAPKDLVLPSPPASAAALSPKQAYNTPTSAKSNNPFSPSKRGDSSPKPPSPRMMHVIAPYTPTLTDELRVQVGDTVRVLQEYQDGWCFAQYVGKADAPKGVVPLVCLEDRRRMVPVGHKTSDSSVTGLNPNSFWRQ